MTNFEIKKLYNRTTSEVNVADMIIYVDVVLLENIVMNYIILMATGIIVKAKRSAIRIFLASLMGAVYAIVSLMNMLEMYASIYMKILLSVVMVYISFKPRTWKILIKEILIFYVTSFVFGGCAFCLLYVIRPQDIFMRNGVYTGTYPIKIALLSAIVGYIIVTIAFKMVKSKISKKDCFCEIKLTVLGKEKTFTAIIDTGNLLQDPISGNPVIVIEKESLEGFIPRAILDNIENIMKGEMKEVLQNLEEREYIAKIRIIPFQSLGKQNGLLLGIKAEEASIVKEEAEEKILSDVMIGIYPHSFTKNKKYTALVGLDIFQNETIETSIEKEEMTK